MLTKAEENSALIKIEAILKELKRKAGDDANSYILTAFSGVVEDARENINSDFANSWKDRAETARREAEKAAAELEKARRIIEAVKLHALKADQAKAAAAIIAERAHDLRTRADKARAAALEIDPEKDPAGALAALKDHARSKAAADRARAAVEALEEQAALDLLQ